MMEDIYTEGRITKTLDTQLKKAKEGTEICPIASVYGEDGFGKTSIIKSWLNHYRLKHLIIDVACLSVREVEIECLPIFNSSSSLETIAPDSKELDRLLTPQKTTVKVVLPEHIIDKIDKDTIIFFDNYGKGSKEVREELIRFIRKFIIVDPRAINEKKYVKKIPFMMIVSTTREPADEPDKYNDYEKTALGLNW